MINAHKIVFDDFLDKLEFINADGTWQTLVKSRDGEIRVEILGDRLKPNDVLLNSARHIFKDINGFIESIALFLKREAESKTGAADEILQLKIESLVLSWPDKPDYGLIHFSGPHAERLWRCDFINGQLVI